MILRKLYSNIIIRILLISINIFLIVLIFRNPKHLFSILISSSILILQIYLLVGYLNKTNRTLANFLGSVLYKDGTFHLPEENSVELKDELSIILNTIGKDLKNSRIESEKQHVYLKNIIDHIDTGILVFNSMGDVELVNRSTLNMFKLPSIKSINDLDKIYPKFSEILKNLIPQIPKLLNFRLANEEFFITIRTNSFKLNNENKKIISFHLINDEMNEAELKSWEKLIRVLTHEIMNSVSPISSLTTTLKRIFTSDSKKKKIEELEDNDIDDTIAGLDIIYNRSQGLLDFIKKYRKVHLMPKPVFEEFDIGTIFSRVVQLFQNDINDHNIDLKLEVYPKTILIYADKAMFEQIIINLFKNAYEALQAQTEKKITVKAYYDLENRTCIEIEDNGPGIEDEIKEDIFVPFFTTKKTGSGIGLSLVKQLAFLNNGKLNVKSELGVGTKFTLVFSK